MGHPASLAMASMAGRDRQRRRRRIRPCARRPVHSGRCGGGRCWRTGGGGGGGGVGGSGAGIGAGVGLAQRRFGDDGGR